MKKALVCGAGGFIGGHLVRRLKEEGYWVRGVDIKPHEWTNGKLADEFLLADLRDLEACYNAIRPEEGKFDEVYQLAADMGGMGFISACECPIMRNNVLINANMIYAAVSAGIPRYFYSSSACVYRDQQVGEPELPEEGAYPALPDNEYGWEKLYSERMVSAFGRKYGIETRIARFQNCFGAEGTWDGGREKAPAAMCRKVAQVEDGGTIEVWGDGKAVRSYIHIYDLLDGIRTLMRSNLSCPVHIGSPEYVTVDQLVGSVAEVAGKKVQIRHVDGPVGVASRCLSNGRIYSLGWRPKLSLQAGLALTYPWIEAQVKKAKA